MKEDKVYIERLISKIRNAYTNDFESPITKGFSLEIVEKEVDHLIEKFESIAQRQNELIKNVEYRIIENDFSPLETSGREDVVDVFSMCFNVYIEELKNKMISKDYFQEIYNEIPINLLILNKNLSIENSNRYGCDFFSISGEYDDQNLEAQFPDTLLIELNEFNSSNQSKKEIEIAFPKGEQIVYISGSLSKIDLKDQSLILFISKDITERKNQQMQILEAIIEGQEMERKRLAIEIHDSLGQELSSLKMNLNSIQNTSTTSNRYHEVMGNLDGIVRSAVQTVKDISFNLKPTLLTTLNLRAALVRLVEVMAIQPLSIHFLCTDKELKLKNKNDELFVYRIIQEFLNNTHKHSNATLVEIEIRKNIKLKQYKIHLKDNGKGFELTNNTTGNGIANIYHRLKILDAEFTFNSNLFNGTQLEFYIFY